MEVSIRLTHAAVPDIFSRQPKRPAAFHSFPLHVRMDIAFQSDIGVGMAQDFAESLDVAAALQAGGGKGMTKLVEATNGHSLVEAENAICYDIVRVYLKTQNCTKRQEKDIKGFYHRQYKEVIA